MQNVSFEANPLLTTPWLLLLSSTTGHKDSVTCATFCHDSSLVATGDMGGLIKVWKVESKEEIWSFEVGDLEVKLCLVGASLRTWRNWVVCLFFLAVAGGIYEGTREFLQFYLDSELLTSSSGAAMRVLFHSDGLFCSSSAVAGVASLCAGPTGGNR